MSCFKTKLGIVVSPSQVLASEEFRYISSILGKSTKVIAPEIYFQVD